MAIGLEGLNPRCQMLPNLLLNPHQRQLRDKALLQFCWALGDPTPYACRSDLQTRAAVSCLCTAAASRAETRVQWRDH